MDPTTVDAVSSLLWPIIVGGAVLLFRKPLTGAIGRLSEVDVGTTKVVLQGQADSAANTTKALIGQADSDSPAPPEITAAKGQIPNTPGTAVLTAWAAVENSVRKAANEAPGSISPSVPEVVNTMAAAKKLDSSLVPVAQSLEKLRSVAATRPGIISTAMATSFVSAASDLARLIGKNQ